MFLKALYDYAENALELPPEGYAPQPVRYALEVGEYGDPEEAKLRDLADERGRVARLTVPRLESGRTSGVNPCLIADNGEYVLCVPREPSGPTKRKSAEELLEDVHRRHASYLALLAECYEETRDEGLGAVLRLYEGLDAPLSPGRFGAPPPAVARLLPEDYDPALRLVFTRFGEPVSDSPAIKGWWDRRTAPDPSDKDVPTGQCMVTGQVGPLVRKMTGSVRGIPGAAPTGAKLISFNKPAFESRGFAGMENAPLSPRAARAVDAALTDLLSRRETRMVVGETVYLFWDSGRAAPDGAAPDGAAPQSLPLAACVSGMLRAPASPETLSLMREVLGEEEPDDPAREEEADPGEAYRLARGLRRLVEAGDFLGADGDRDLSGRRLNALALGANSARVAVRASLWGPAPQMLSAAANFVLAQRLPARDGVTVLPPRGVGLLCLSALPPGREADADRLADALLRSFLGGHLAGDDSALARPLPGALLASLARRGRGGLSDPAAQLAKLALTTKGAFRVRTGSAEAITDPAIDQDDADGTLLRPPADPEHAVAYDLGRLLAHLDAVQDAAVGNVGASVGKTRYDLVRVTPRRGLSPLVNKANGYHLPKLRRRRPGLARTLEAEYDAILAGLPTEFPERLDVERQLAFGLGFRAQQVRKTARARAAAAKRDRAERERLRTEGRRNRPPTESPERDENAEPMGGR